MIDAFIYVSLLCFAIIGVLLVIPPIVFVIADWLGLIKDWPEGDE